MPWGGPYNYEGMGKNGKESLTLAKASAGSKKPSTNGGTKPDTTLSLCYFRNQQQ